MSDSQLGISVRIETQADVAAVEKTTGELRKMEGVTDDLDASLARLKNTLAQAEAGLKQAGEQGTAAGAQLGAGMKVGAKEAADALSGILPVSNVNDLIQGAWSIGTDIGTKLGEGIQLAMSDRLTWDNLFGDGLAQEEATMNARQRFRDVQQAHSDLVEQLNKAPGNAITDFLSHLTEVAKEAAQNLAELNKLQTLANKGEDAADKETFQQRRDDVDASGMSKGDKIRAKAAIDNEEEDLNRIKKEERRTQEVEAAQRATDAANQQAAALAAAAQEARKRQETALGIEGGDQYMRAKAGGADDHTLQNMYDRRAREAGYDDLGTPQQEAANVKKADAAAKAAASAARIAAAKERGTTERADIEGDQDMNAAEAAKRRRSANAERSAEGADASDASKEAADAAKAATSAEKKAGSDTKAVAAQLKRMADMVEKQGDTGKQWAAALEKMAADLADGASGGEMKRIEAAMRTVGSTQNEAFNSLAASVDSMINSIEKAAQDAADARRKAEALEAKVNAMR